MRRGDQGSARWNAPNRDAPNVTPIVKHSPYAGADEPHQRW